MQDRTWLRATVALIALGAVAYALVASPVGAGGSLTRRKVKNIATRVVKGNTGIFSVSKEGPAPTPTSLASIASLSLPAGTYAVFAKGVFGRTTPGTGPVECELFAGGASVDRSVVVLGDGATGDTIPLQAVVNGGEVELRCVATGIGSNHRHVKITAVMAPSATTSTL